MCPNLKKSLVADVLLLCVLVVVVSLIACRTYRWRDFRPLEHEQPIVMFDRYRVEFHGFASTYHNLYIMPSFVNEIRDTLSWDTLPVFVVDSVCFSGSCIENAFCRKPRSWAETRDRYPGTYYLGKSVSNEPFRDEDIYYIDAKVVPGGFEFTDAYRLPSSCTDSSVFVDIQARLLDRATGDEIAREVRRLRFLITPKKKWILFSQMPASYETGQV
jgi:hypothetical protein